MELYVHFPFCVKKCRYCDFASYPGLENQMDAYVDALITEAELRQGDLTEPLQTVYFGGGTPSLLPPDTMNRCILELKKRIPFDQVHEWTIEANPGTVSESWLAVCIENGVNRISIGMQAAQFHILSILGRIHTVDDVFESISLARNIGFDNVSLDLMFGIPGQSIADWIESINTAISMHPEHLSAYGLIPEENTPLWKDLCHGKLILPEPEVEREMYEILLKTLAQNGYEQYEISNFSKPGYTCRHNIGYWDQIPYIGLGLSAASMMNSQITPSGMSYHRKTNVSGMQEYMRGIRNRAPALSEDVQISPQEARFETMMLGLRMNQGVSESVFQRRHGISMNACYGPRLQSLRERGLLIRNGDVWKLTRQGMDLQNMVLVELMD